MTEPSSTDSQQGQVLAQALRAMAGGPSGAPATSGPSGLSHSAPARAPEPRRGLSTAQLLLLAAIIGVVLGGGVAIATLLL